MILCFAVLLASMLPTTILAATSDDLRDRITIDGNLSDFLADEHVVDDTSSFPEAAGDSRWGADHDASALLLTWDNYNLYIGIRAVTASGHLMLALDTACGGLDDLTSAGPFTRNIEFSAMQPNVLVSANRTAPSVAMATIDCETPMNAVDPALYQAVYVQDGIDDGALEIAIPWELVGDFVRSDAGTLVPAGGVTLRVVAFVTGGIGTGAGDAIPDPSVRLENDSTRVAILNNHAALLLDGDGDGFLDTGVMPRSAATFAVSQAENVSLVLPLRVVMETKLIEPGLGKQLSFYATLDPAQYNQAVYLTASVYSSDGRLVKKLFEDEARDMSPGAAPVMDTWDGRDLNGRLVSGGVYVLAVSGGPGPAAPKKTVTASFAVVR